MKHLALVALAAAFLAMHPADSFAQDGATSDASEMPAVYQWDIDQTHSAITFNVRHFFTPVTGRFQDYDVELLFDPENLDESSITVSIPVNSIDTNNDRRDSDLRSENYFAAETWPNIRFASSHIMATGENEFVAHGKLTIRDVTTDFALPFTLLGVMELSAEQTERSGRKARAGFSSEATIDRHDYGVGPDSDTVIGETVTINVAIEATRK